MHKSIPDFAQHKAVNGNITKAPYTLVIYGAVGCGHTQAAIRDIHNYGGCGDLQVIIVEEDSRNDILEYQNEFFAHSTFYSNEEMQMEFKNFFPQYYLYKGNQLIWNANGYVQNATKVLDQKIICNEERIVMQE